MPVIYDIDELEKAAAEKHTRVREAIRSPLVPLTLQQLETDMQGKAPSYGVLLKQRLTANARKSRYLGFKRSRRPTFKVTKVK